MSVARVMERFFPDLAKIEAEEIAAVEGRIARIQELVSRQAFKEELLDWLEAELEAAQPRPDTEQGMLYSIGKRDGLALVRDRLRFLQTEARRNDV